MRRNKKILFLLVVVGLSPFLVLNAISTASANPGEVSKTFTFNADFEEGEMVGVECESIPDQLQLSEETSTFSYLWIANAGEDTLSKWDTETNTEVARYNTWFSTYPDHDAWTGASPSRTCVDGEGNCYVANRHFDGRPTDVMKVLVDEWIDRNGNGILDTSFDANFNGEITPDEMQPMLDGNGNGIIEDSEIQDERIAWIVRVGNPNGIGRSLSIDPEGNIWVGLYSSRQYYKLDSISGDILGGPYTTLGSTPYGSLVDKYGILWSASLSNRLFWLNTSDPSQCGMFTEPYCSTYGMALNYDIFGNTIVYLADSSTGKGYIQFNSSSKIFSIGPVVKPNMRVTGIATDSYGNIIIASYTQGYPIKYSPEGIELWRNYSTPVTESRGVIVDGENNIWLCHRAISKLSKHLGENGNYVGSYETGLFPYTYSDATGLSYQQSISQNGYWRIIFDSEEDNSKWGRVSWTDYIPVGGNLEVRVRSSNDGLSWTGWEYVSNNIFFDYIPDGRYLQIDVKFEIGDEDLSPILYDLTVQIGDPKSLKMEAKNILEDLHTGIRCIDVNTRNIIHQIELSLCGRLWKDESHLDFKHGDQVFVHERNAVNHMEKMIAKYQRIIDAYEEPLPTIMLEKSLSKIDPTILIPLLENVIITYEKVCKYLTMADMILAQIASEESAALPITSGKWETRVEMYLEKSTNSLFTGNEQFEQGEWEKAVSEYRDAWRYAMDVEFWALKK
ncbi:hypothetical protein NEF87_001643 [Candidatus Lokiarchaeum ossiferum]|uniref:EF-hand domain-containing protein n=1 Tax=Candidatus Lokiarchaeum ossiferum TaxID=2951803 RepID=A0ABY6HPB0_9ARCH|nr:hypothetical protein NEF87_001643 [Candidatus Lokiarchaeum sp. B-35]